MTTEPVTATGVFALTAVLIALPLAGAAILLLGGKRTNKWGPILGSLTVFGSAVLGTVMLITMMGKPAEERTFIANQWDWVSVGDFHANVALQLDQLSLTFVLLITWVGLLIHIYSIGYMSHDPDRRKFFGMLNLFVAAMLILVLADNYLLLYVGWEGVGLASYLLIGFWQYKHSAAQAAKKAFIINRVGDVGLSLAVIMIFVTFGSVTYSQVFPQASSADPNIITWIGLALLLAACGKSAQFPLQAWLMDAMEGPTPVSALIHAATMVTAGVYLIVRSGAIFNETIIAATAVAIVGVISMFLGAWIGSSKDEIKKALAGSTMSQIGYMIMGAGLGPVGYVFAIFHLLMHGIFKAGLFLGAGSVMHGFNNQENMRRFGAVRTVMHVTFWVFFICTLSIMGIPPFSGFWSKDSIIHAAFEVSIWYGLAGMLAAGLTGFYMVRILSMTFFGQKRWDDDVHPHESPKVMLIPMIILAIGAIFGGMALLYWGNIETWLEPVTGLEEVHLAVPEWVLEVITLVIVLIGATIAWFHVKRGVDVEPKKENWFAVAGKDEVFGNVINDTLVVEPSFKLSHILTWIDAHIVDGVVMGLAGAVTASSGGLRRWQTGFARSYALSMVGGVILVLLVLVVVRFA